MKKTVSTLYAIAISALCFSQANHYVAPSGNDGAEGSIEHPWKTIQYASNQLVAGDTLNLRSGTYAGKIDINVSGKEDEEISIRAYKNEQVVINGAGLSDYEYLLKIQDVKYINISGIKFKDYQKLDAIGILVINSSNISIRGNEFSNIDYSSSALGETPRSSKNSQPIIVFGRDANHPVSNLLINSNIIHDCETGYSECLSINGNVDGFEVQNNHIYNNTNIPIAVIGFEGECKNTAFDQARNGLIRNNHIHDNPSAYAAAGGIYIDGGKSIIVENNFVYNNDYGIEIGCENNGEVENDPSASNIIVRNNLIYNNGIAGIALGGYDYPKTGKVENTIIRNNTCFNNDTEDSYNGEMLISYVENSVVENNIFYAKNADNVLIISDEENPTLSFNYNLYYTPNGSEEIVIEIDGEEYNEFSTYKEQTSQDANSSFSDPFFVSINTSNPDFHLAASSPATDAGNPYLIGAPGETDMDGEKRVFNGRVDCGADEYASYVGMKINQNPQLHIYPNPGVGIINFDPDIKAMSYEVYSVAGKLFGQGSVVYEKIDLRDFSPGIYLLKVTTAEGESLEELVLIGN